ncbi:MAG: EAL domain-containing protein, partial [Nitrospirae bacterium]|nr:EAL domain-containing protein [Nitrospirota bacterium]
DRFLSCVHPGDLESVKKFVSELVDEYRPRNIDFRIVRSDGAERFVHMEGRVERDEGEIPVRIVGYLQDVTERKMVEEKVHFLAYYDSLTGLPNRTFFKELIQRELSNARRIRQTLGICFIDLDNFKEINDGLGHEAGDQLLQTAAERILGSIRGSDYVSRYRPEEEADVLSRLGGDEFVLLLHNLARVEDAGTAARRVLKSVSQPYRLDGREVFITASIGISLYPEDGSDVDTLLRNADVAMYDAKKRGRNNHQFFSRTMNATAMEKAAIESRLKEALDRREFVLYYQSILETSTRKIIGMEALLRWHRPGQDIIPPDKFIHSAEENGMIVPIGDWVLHAACSQGRAWQEAGTGPLTVAVNLSRRQLEQKNLVEVVTRVLSETGFPPSWLELEITESTVMRNLDEALATLQELKGMGVRIAMDDFGTGYSSLNYLRRLPLDALKIDREFIENITRSRRDAAVVKVMIDLAHSLDLKVIAEGVETEPQAAFLLDQGCDEVQGFLFGRPSPAEEISRVLGFDMNGFPPS